MLKNEGYNDKKMLGPMLKNSDKNAKNDGYNAKNAGSSAIYVLGAVF
jgi:hypothetical protein